MKIVLNVIYRCEKCKEQLEFIGVTEEGKYKYFCNKCYKLIMKNTKDNAYG